MSLSGVYGSYTAREAGLASFNELRIVPLNTLNEGVISRDRPPFLTTTLGLLMVG